MDQLNTSIEEFVLKDNSFDRLKVLLHTKERRSLGPREDEEQSNIKEIISSPKLEKTPTKSKYYDIYAEDLSMYDEIKERTISALDIDQLSSAIQMRSEEQRIKKIQEEEVSKFASIQTSQNKKLQEIYDKSLKEQAEAYRRQKTEDNKRIAQEAELETKKTLQAHKEELDKLHAKNQKKLRDTISLVISKYHSKFKSGYEKVTILLKSADKENLKNMQKHNEILKNIITMFDEVISKVKNNDIGPKELQSAELLVQKITELEQSIIKEIQIFASEKIAKEKEAQNEAKEAQSKAVEVPTPAPVVEQPVVEQIQLPPPTLPPKEEPDSAPKEIVKTVPATNNNNQFVHPERLMFYNRIMEFYTQKVESVKPLQADDNAKKYRGTCKRILHSYINTISADSAQQLNGGYEKIINFISGARVQDVCVNDHPLAKDFCLLTMAKKFVNDAETIVSSNSKSAFPLAKIIVSIWVKVPEFGQLFLAYLFKASPFLVPYIIPFVKGQSIQDYQKALGYQVSAEGKVEMPDSYLKRQSGLMRLYGAVMISKARKADQSLPHPFCVENAWSYICHMIKLETLPDICSTLLLEILEMTGNQLLKIYGRQFGNVLVYIKDFYYPKLKLDEHGPISRLELLLSDIFKDHRIKPPEGFLSDNFW